MKLQTFLLIRLLRLMLLNCFQNMNIYITKLNLKTKVSQELQVRKLSTKRTRNNKTFTACLQKKNLDLLIRLTLLSAITMEWNNHPKTSR